MWADIPEGHEDKSDRPCIVTVVEDDYVELVYGRGRPGKSPDDVEVAVDSRLGKRFGLTKPTYFRPGSVVLVSHTRISRAVGFCPRTEFHMFERIAQEERAREYANQRRDERRREQRLKGS